MMEKDVIISDIIRISKKINKKKKMMISMRLKKAQKC